MFPIKSYKHFSVEMQITVVVILFVATVLLVYSQYQITRLWFGIYPISITLFLAPIYEELIFRWILFTWIKKDHGWIQWLIWSSLVFWIRHIKNIFYHPYLDTLIWQIGYTGLVVWPLMAYVYHKTWNIWLCVILHFINNLIAWYIVWL